MRCAHSRSCKSRNARSMKQRSASNKTNTSALQLIASSTASSISLSFGSMYGLGWTRQAGGIERAWHLGGRHYDGIARKRSAEVGERLSVLVGDWWAVQPARQAPRRSGRRYVRDGQRDTDGGRDRHTCAACPSNFSMPLRAGPDMPRGPAT